MQLRLIMKIGVAYLAVLTEAYFLFRVIIVTAQMVSWTQMNGDFLLSRNIVNKFASISKKRLMMVPYFGSYTAEQRFDYLDEMIDSNFDPPVLEPKPTANERRNLRSRTT
mmetsp:Transcript_8794/g.12460  ORF Transcript_8794/g.12460 Transcript_8794/m.12460 type:complete len:110 (+) Transcript_8794:216-545(+)